MIYQINLDDGRWIEVAEVIFNDWTGEKRSMKIVDKAAQDDGKRIIEMKFKISYDDHNSLFSTKPKEFKNLREAVSYFLEPPTYCYEGRKQQLEKKAELTEQLLANLIDILTEKQILGKEELTALFSNKYEIENEE